MQRRRRRQVAMLAAAALAVSGCQSDGAGDADDLGLDDVTGSQADEESSDVATEPEAESEDTNELDEDTEPEVSAETDLGSETESEEDPFAIPDEIDTEYVSRVVNELYRLEAETYEAARSQLEAGETLPPALFEELRDVFVGDRLTVRAVDLQTRVDESFVDMPEERGLATFQAGRLEQAQDTCIVAVGTVDISESSPQAPFFEIEAYLFALIPNQNIDRNSTPWVIAQDGLAEDVSAADFPEACA